MSEVNIICMKWGTQYGPEYVNKLYTMVSRHLTLPFQFHCLTDDVSGIVSEVITHPIPSVYVSPSDQVSGWRKLTTLAEDLPLSGKVLFLDLDLIIVDNIDCFFSYSEKFCIIENWTQKNQGIGNSSVYCFEAGRYTDVLDAYKTAPEKIIADYDNEQIFLSRQLGQERMAYWPEKWCVSFKHHGIGRRPKWKRLIKTPTIPEGAKIVVFHGLPKPEHALQGVWPGLWLPYMRKALWVEEHWR